MGRAPSRFAIEAKVAVGGMGVVYRARDTETGRLVAYKLVETPDRELVDRFAREAQIVATLDHPAIVQHVAHGVDLDGAPFLAMEWVDGATLHDQLDEVGLSAVEAMQLVSRLAHGLRHAHAHGVVHRDVKPSNILLPGGDLAAAKIADFGIARTADGLKGLTATGALVGTPSYMSPEQARGERTVDARCDVFALGCVLYECLTGHKTFEGKHPLALIAKVVLWDPPPPSALVPEIPAPLDALVKRMLAKQPSHRPGDDEVIEALARIDADTLPATRRPRQQQRRAARAEVTSKLPARPPLSVMIASSAASADGSSDVVAPELLDERRAQIARALGGREVRAEVFNDGSVLVVTSGNLAGADAALMLADCARVIGGVLPELMLAITTGELDGSQRDLLENTVGALAREAMLRTFARNDARPPGAIRLDAATAKLLDGEPIVQIGDVAYLRGAAG